jgi:hypothetical protein
MLCTSLGYCYNAARREICSNNIKGHGFALLLPEKIASHTLADLKSKLSESLEFYQSLLPNPLLFWTELVLYKSNLEMRGSKAIPTNLDEALQEINSSIFPNLFTSSSKNTSCL